MSIGQICNRHVVTIGPNASIREAAELMRTLHVGDLVVVEGQAGSRVPLGILTDRDIVVEIIAEEVDASAVSVGDVMSSGIVTAGEDDDVLETVKGMRSAGIRRIPVVDDGGVLMGIVSVDDILQVLAEGLSDVASLIFREREREEDTRR